MTMTPLFPNEAPFELSAYYPASRVRFVHIPAGVREAGFHTPPGRLLAIWLDGEVEFETSDGEVRRVTAGKAVIVEDTHGKGHISRHPPEGQNLILVMLPDGLDQRFLRRLMAQNGPPGMSVQCPLTGQEQTSRRKAATSVFNPKSDIESRGLLWPRAMNCDHQMNVR